MAEEPQDGKSTLDLSELAERLKNMGFATKTVVDLEDSKMATIAQMLPTDIGVFEVLDKKGKAEIFKGIPAMDKHLPKILEKDFTSVKALVGGAK